MRSKLVNQIRLLSTCKDPKTRYVLAMFPYPSGRLHMGHMRVYSISDSLAKYYRLNGFNVLHPIGWDSFGLPAENAARSKGVKPQDWTQQNIDVMREQLKRTGVDFDWDREISTCQPDYYKWTQWIFIKLFENNLVNRRFSSVYWDPVDETVLAAEQIDANGCSWRSGALAEKRKLKQWAVETPKYAKRLLDGLEKIKEDCDEVAAIQANWIGKCDVYRFILPVHDNGKNAGEVLDLRISDPTELLHAEFVVLQSDHSLADKIQDKRYVSQKSVVNFVNGRSLPIVFLAPDEQQNEEFFLKARLGFTAKSSFDKSLASSFGLSKHVKIQQIDADKILQKATEADLGGYQTSRTLQDWVVSRQRAWGTPIPILVDQDNDDICRPVPIDLLPVLSEQRGQLMGDNGRIEIDTLDTFFDSSWYFLRFLDPFNSQMLADPTKIRDYMPVDVYVGGIEHADVHIYFARFISYFLYDIGVSSVMEPFKRLLSQGFVRGRTFVEVISGRYVPEANAEQIGEDEWKAKDTGKSLEVIYEKMSKSKLNGVDPLVVIDEIGVDLTRLRLLSLAAPRSTLNWTECSEFNMKGLRRWIERMDWVISNYVEQRQSYANVKDLQLVSTSTENHYRDSYNYTVSVCMGELNLHNTAIARLQGLTNTLRKMNVEEAGRSLELERCVYALVVMLQIFAPNTAQTLWQKLQLSTPLNPNIRGPDTELSNQMWPQLDNEDETDIIYAERKVKLAYALRYKKSMLKWN